MSSRSRISNNLFKTASGSRSVKALRSVGLASVAIATATIFVIAPSVGLQTAAYAQAPASSKQIGTVKVILPNKLTIATDTGKTFQINVVDDAKVLRLAPGSTDLKTAQAITLGDIEVGDRVLVTGHEDAADAFTASRVILMKSSDITQKHEAEQEDWQKRGSGGLVSAVDPAAGVLTITARGNKVAVKTSPATTYRRYAGDSIKYQDAVTGTLDQIQVGDQLRVRGTKSTDPSAPSAAPAAGGPPAVSIQAEEIVSGSFKNLAGTIVSIDQASDTVTVKDLATKKTFSLKVTSNSNIRALPPEAAARFAVRAKGGQSGSGQGAAPGSGSERPAGGPPNSGAPGQGGGSAGGDLSQLIGRLPEGSLGDLHVGEALMVVASQPQAGSISLVAITLLSGVEPILAATPAGTSTITLSPWNFGGGEGGGA